MVKRTSPQLKVVTHRPWRRAVVVVAILVVGVAGLGVGYLFGQQTLDMDRDSYRIAVKELEVSKEKLARLETELIDAQLSSTVQRQAGNALRENLTVELDKSARLQEEVTFYKGLMSPSSLAKGLQVAELEILPAADSGQYRYQLLLTQVALRRSYIAGEVRIDLIGRYLETPGNAEVVLSLTELDDLKAYPLKFRFRYFQDLAGQIAVPAGFEPDRVVVTANQSGKEPLQVTFAWPLPG